MRFVNAAGRAALLEGDRLHDLHALSGAALPWDPTLVVAGHWDEARAVHARGAWDEGAPLDGARLGPPVPRPGSVFAVAVNYRSHAAESSLAVPERPAIFTKFRSSLAGPHDDIVLPPGDVSVDWEAELAFVVARGGRHIDAGHALDHLAGYTVAQDVSERRLQMAAGRQFSLGKSFDTFCPMGPALVTLDELADPLALRITCRVNGEVVQEASTADMIADVPSLVAYLSSVLTLNPGDVCLTGTPSGVGMGRTPPVFLAPGDVVETAIEGVGHMRNRCVAEGG